MIESYSMLVETTIGLFARIGLAQEWFIYTSNGSVHMQNTINYAGKTYNIGSIYIDIFF